MAAARASSTSLAASSGWSTRTARPRVAPPRPPPRGWGRWWSGGGWVMVGWWMGERVMDRWWPVDRVMVGWPGYLEGCCAGPEAVLPRAGGGAGELRGAAQGEGPGQVPGGQGGLHRRQPAPLGAGVGRARPPAGSTGCRSPACPRWRRGGGAPAGPAPSPWRRRRPARSSSPSPSPGGPGNRHRTPLRDTESTPAPTPPLTLSILDGSLEGSKGESEAGSEARAGVGRALQG